MNKLLIFFDRLIYVALLALIFFLPFSFALIAICQVTMAVAWTSKRLLLCQMPARQDCAQGFNFISNSMGWALIAIGLLIALTLPLHHYPALTIKKFISRFLQQAFLMYLITEIVHSRKRLYGVLSVLLFAFFLVGVDVTIQYTWGKSVVHHTLLTLGRVSGPMNHPNDLGTLLVTVLPMVFVSIIICRKRTALRVVVPALFLLLAAALGLTGSRGAWVAFAVSMVALGFGLKRPKLTVLIVSMLTVFFWVYGTYYLSTRTHTYDIRMYDILMKPGHVISSKLMNPFGLPPGYHASALFLDYSGRESYWDTAIAVVKHYPWFGCGYNEYIQTLRDLHIGHEEYPHNSLLHITAELGLAGLILYCWLFAGLCARIKNVLRAVSREGDLFLLGVGASSGILAWLIHSLLDTPWSSLQLSLLLWLMIGILLSLGFVLPKQERMLW